MGSSTLCVWVLAFLALSLVSVEGQSSANQESSPAGDKSFMDRVQGFFKKMTDRMKEFADKVRTWFQSTIGGKGTPPPPLPSSVPTAGDDFPLDGRRPTPEVASPSSAATPPPPSRPQGSEVTTPAVEPEVEEP